MLIDDQRRRERRRKMTLARRFDIALISWLMLAECSQSFQQPAPRRRHPSQHPPLPSSSLNVVAGDTGEPILSRAQRVLQQNSPSFDPQFDNNLRSIFPRAITNYDLAIRVVQTLERRGFSASNTLLTTSLCSDELAKQLSDDFGGIYGNSFNLGGLAGFPFAGNIGFQTMCGHIPDGGGCLLLYGPHVGVTVDGIIGKVEREGVSQDDICCRSAIEALNFVTGQTNTGVADFAFTDLQQGAVQNLVAPLSDRLVACQNPMGELPFAIYDTQTDLIDSIVREGIGGIKERGIVILGGVQINTSPRYMDYFQTMRFDLIDSNGQLVENLLLELLV